jgi:hypothetical protein
MADSKDKRATDAEKLVVSVPSPRAVSGARELQRDSERPTMPPPMPTMPEMPAITNPPVSQERALRVDPVDAEAEAEDEIPELLRSTSARPPTRLPSTRPPPNVTRITPGKKVGGFEEEVVVNRKDPRREE